MAKKDKKSKAKESEPPVPEVQDEQLLGTTDLEPVPEEVQFTDTSYTSASFESLPPVIEEIKPKRKRGLKGKKSSQIVTTTVTSEVFDWSQESLPVDEGEEVQKVEEEEVKKKKKGKKGKKEKVVEEIPQFEKPKNWKKMNKKERDQWMVDRIEQWRAEKEAEKQAILAGAKEKRIALEKERNDLMVKDIAEQEVRRDILQKTCNYFHQFEAKRISFLNKKQLEAEWLQYLRCDGLPDPRVVKQTNTYLHLWRLKMTCDDNDLERRCAEALPIIEMLETILSNPRIYTKRQFDNYDEARQALRAQLSATIEMASYALIRDLEKNLKWHNIKLATYKRAFKGLRLELWVAVRMPTRKPKPIEPDRVPVELSFPDMNVNVILPTIIDGGCVCVRAARSLIDLLSENTRSFHLMPDPRPQYRDLFEFNVKELIEITALKKKNDTTRSTFYKDIKDKIKALEAFIKANIFLKNEKEKDDLDLLNMAEPPFIPDPRTFVSENGEKDFLKYMKTCNIRTRAGELNLRKYRICGGILNLDLLVTPPQAKFMRNGITLTSYFSFPQPDGEVQLPKALEALKYQVQYRAPPPPPPGVTRTPEEIEAEIKKMEREYEKLALVSIDLPQNVMWTEPPVVCQWQEPRKLWTFNYVNDYKYNEDKLTLQFRTGVLWPIGIAALKYGNLPYQAWDMKPNPKGKGVLITVTGVAITVTWLIRSNCVQLKFIANATTSALKEYFNKKLTVKAMMKLMRESACDFFPDFDAHNHVEGSCQKEWVVEKHNYHAMAFLSRAYNFQWSRWNAGAGWRNIIMQLREAVDTKREGKLQLLYVTPQRATILRDNEMTTQEISFEPMAGLPFYPDLFALNMAYGSVDARRTCFNMKYQLVETVFEFLQELKLSSFS